MHIYADRSGKIVNKICCYKCKGNNGGLLIEEKIDTESGKVISKEFICAGCQKKENTNV